MINIEEEYLGLLSGVLHGGYDKPDRTGTGTKSVFGRMIRHDMALGFPLLTTKKIYFKNAIAETLWIINGRVDLDYLHSNGVRYWEADYKRSGRTDGTLGPVYGHQWRNFNGVDQFRSLVREIKQNPTSRRLMLSSWNPVDMPDMVLPPCHHSFQLYSDGVHLDLMLQQRSADLFLGVPFNIASYALLTEMIAHVCNLQAGDFVHTFGDAHIYKDHFDQMELQLKREPRTLPELKINKKVESIFDFKFEDFEVINYDPHPHIKGKVSV